MKKYFIILSVAVFLFAGCNGNQTKKHDHNNGTHQHDDGAIHTNHTEDATSKEEFTAEKDSTIYKEEKHDHPHSDNHKHSH